MLEDQYTKETAAAIGVASSAWQSVRLELRSSMWFSGPNLWFRAPVIQCALQVRNIEDRQQGAPRDLERHFTAILAQIAEEQRVSSGVPCPPVVDFHGLIQATAWLSAGLQRCLGMRATFWTVKREHEQGMYLIAVEGDDQDAALAAVRLAVDLAHGLLAGTVNLDSLLATWQAFVTQTKPFVWGASTQTIVESARARGIPVRRIPFSGVMLELGNGRYRRRAHRMTTSRTPFIGVKIAKNKYLNDLLLERAGLPVPRSVRVETPDEAVAAAERIGNPVVVKPVDGNRGHGVAVNLYSPELVREAIHDALRHSRARAALVQEFVSGNHYRILIIGSQIVSVVQRIVAHVIGDGSQSVQKLIEATNAARARHRGEHRALKPIPIDAKTVATLARQGIGLSYVAANDEVVRLRFIGPSDGGASIECTDRLHPENAALALQAAAVVGIDIAGIDFIALDISESVWETGGAIVEVNTGPAFNAHLHPHAGKSTNLGKYIVDTMYPPESPSRVTIITVIQGAESAEVCRLIHHILNLAGHNVSLATADDLVVDGLSISPVHWRQTSSFHAALSHPATEVLVAEVDPATIMWRGLEFDYCDVAVVATLSGAKTPAGNSIESVLTQLTEPCGHVVLKADCSALMSEIYGANNHVVLFGDSAPDFHLRSHLANGGVTVTLTRRESEDTLVLTEGTSAEEVCSLSHGKQTWLSEHGYSLSTLLPAVAAAVAAGVPMNVIHQALEHTLN